MPPPPLPQAALEESIRIREKKRIETEALIAHLEELVAASEVADTQAKTAKELEKAWETAISSRCKAERQAQGTLDAERRRTASQVAELHTEVARVRLFDDAAAAKIVRIETLDKQLKALQRQAVAQKMKEEALTEALRVQEQEKKDARERNKRIDVIRRKVQAGFIPQSKLQDHIDDIIQEVHGTEGLETGIAKDNARLDKREAKKAAREGRPRPKKPRDQRVDEEGNPVPTYRDLAMEEEEIGRTDQRTPADYEAWVEQVTETDDLEANAIANAAAREAEAAAEALEEELPDANDIAALAKLAHGEETLGGGNLREAVSTSKTLEEHAEDTDELLPAWRKGALRNRAIVSIRCFSRAGRIQGLVAVQFVDGSEWEGPWDDSIALLIGRDGKEIEGNEGLQEQGWGGDMSMMPARASAWPMGVGTSWRTSAGTKWEGEFMSLDFEPSKVHTFLHEYPTSSA